mgnify:CR=1 FL=1
MLKVHASSGRTWPQNGDASLCGLRPLPDGAWTLGFRAHHLRAGKGSDRALTFRLKVVSSEITGSESFIHVTVNGERWVMLTQGVHAHAPGAALEGFVEPQHVMTFDGDGLAVKFREAA